jgi:uncharacterized protein (DUF2062 family)
MTPEAAATVVALGLVLGVFPAPLLPTLLCAAAAAALRLNAPALQLVNCLAYPLQIALAAPFASLGGRLFGKASIAVATDGAVWRMASGLWMAGTHAAAAWLCVCAPLGALLYVLLALALRRRAANPA